MPHFHAATGLLMYERSKTDFECNFSVEQMAAARKCPMAAADDIWRQTSLLEIYVLHSISIRSWDHNSY